MMDDLYVLEDWLGGLLSQLSPAERRRAAIDVGRELRRSQQKRIVQQRNPDGTAYEPRKARQFMRNARLREKAGRIKRKAMFAKLRTARFMKVEADSSGVSVGFAGRVARLARVHQEGQTAEVTRGGPSHTYPVRQLLGFTEADQEMIRDKLLEHLARSA
ncbi:phage virion morphogenesis protein [Massilia sp. YIM B02763]|uniref:phage virion morphogenesis protein n=1 Tax=Massilia sp. YIM B02763 TaxID=3050130 RepID=UPI0025B62EDB|nr:phage virion morphogenesis protein [Massilia sp. YIM B02763]MDN4056335.1 phage virion morphogenesis protein [Massilia sp. YIM B02763]